MMSGSCVLDLTWSIPELTRGSCLSGPFYIFRMSSAPGQIIARIARPVRYLNMGTKWTLGRKYEGTDR
jgi:hypothetical protein